MNLTYQSLGGSEWSGGPGGALGIRIDVGGDLPADLDTPAIRSACRDAVEAIHQELIAAKIAENPKSKTQSADERADLMSLFPGRIFVESIPNGYSNDAYNRHLPWFVVTTAVGRFTVGWRKRVIHLDWSQTVGTKKAEELFADQNVTKDGRSIHAWTLEDARKYVAKVIETATPST